MKFKSVDQLRAFGRVGLLYIIRIACTVLAWIVLSTYRIAIECTICYTLHTWFMINRNIHWRGRTINAEHDKILHSTVYFRIFVLSEYIMRHRARPFFFLFLIYGQTMFLIGKLRDNAWLRQKRKKYHTYSDLKWTHMVSVRNLKQNYTFSHTFHYLPFLRIK